MGTVNSKETKRVAKNTLLLYIRMFVTMVVGLYTSRVILNVLGASDYGVYNVVGGVITLSAFLNSSLTSASQRFITFELGKGDLDSVKRVFCTTVNIYVLISVVILLLAETIGLWFVNTKLNIPEGRMVAANWVYQASIISFIINLLSVPYTSLVVAHEDMKMFAYVSILEVVLKLAIVFALVIIPYDKLIVYSILMVIVGLLIRLCYTLYCKRHYNESGYSFIFDKNVFKNVLSFTSWSILGNLGFTFKDQISNIIVNLFYGTTVNAARGIGIQVTSIVKTFAGNFTMALNPQITKQYAAGNLDESKEFVYMGCRYTAYLLTMIIVPILLNVDELLSIWLVDVPEFTSYFVVFSLLISYLHGISGPVTIAIQATARIKWFQIGICIIMLSELPIAWVLMKLGYPPYAVMWPSLLTYSLALVFRFILIRKYVSGYSVYEYFIKVVLRCFLVFIVSFLCCFLFEGFFHSNIIDTIFSSLLYVLLSTIVIIILGLHKEERLLLYKKVRERVFTHLRE